MKKIYALPIMMLLVMTTFALACENSVYSLREDSIELRDVNIYSNGATGSGYIIDTIHTGYKTIYQFQERNGVWQVRIQQERIRGNWENVNVYYNPYTGIWSVPSLNLYVKTINLK